MNQCLIEAGVPVVTPAGGLGVHLDAQAFLPHLDPFVYPSGALAAALYVAGGIRTMERGTMSEARAADGKESIVDMELVRIAIPRRVFTLSQLEYVIDRIVWLHQHRHLIGGLKFTDEPEILRFFTGRLAPTDNWPERLIEAFKIVLPNSL